VSEQEFVDITFDEVVKVTEWAIAFKIENKRYQIAKSLMQPETDVNSISVGDSDVLVTIPEWLAVKERLV